MRARFDQSPDKIHTDLNEGFKQYFSEFPWSNLNEKSVGFDLGCGSGRWAKFVAPKVGVLHCCDASKEAIEVAKKNLKSSDNCIFHCLSVDEMPFEKNSMDFGYSLGVLHHIPDTIQGLKTCVDKLRIGAPFLLYLYYDFDNRPFWYGILHKMTEPLRKIISKLPYFVRYWACQIIATLICYPIARTAYLLEKFGLSVSNIPLYAYRKQTFYSMRTDALDRFGTKLEKRFSRKEIEKIMISAGLEKITFREGIPYWCAVGQKTH